MRRRVGRIRNMSASILAGGRSRRMGRNKALLSYRGRPLVRHVYDTLEPLFEEIFLVTNTPGVFGFLPCPAIPDRIPGKGPISGVDAALRHSRNPHVLIVGCDAPFLSPRLLMLLAAKAKDADLVIPRGPAGPEPLCAVYGKGCLPTIEASLCAGDFQLVALIRRLRTLEVPPEEVAAADPGFRSFLNINTPEDLLALGETHPGKGTRRHSP